MLFCEFSGIFQPFCRTSPFGFFCSYLVSLIHFKVKSDIYNCSQWCSQWCKVSSMKWTNVAHPGPLNKKFKKKENYSYLKTEISKKKFIFFYRETEISKEFLYFYHDIVISKDVLYSLQTEILLHSTDLPQKSLILS